MAREGREQQISRKTEQKMEGWSERNPGSEGAGRDHMASCEGKTREEFCVIFLFSLR